MDNEMLKKVMEMIDLTNKRIDALDARIDVIHEMVENVNEIGKLRGEQISLIMEWKKITDKQLTALTEIALLKEDEPD